MFFEDWSNIWRTLVIGTLGYGALIVWLRVSGKRTLSRWNAFDAVVTFALGSMLATATLSPATTLAQGLAAFGLFVVLQAAITWLAVRSALVRRLIKARPTLLLHEGQLLHAAMKRERVTEGEVLAALRDKGLASVGEAHAVVLETSGTFSVVASRASGDHSALRDVEGIA